MNTYQRKASNNAVQRVELYDSSSSTGALLASLAFNTSGLVIEVQRELDAAKTSYTVAASNIEDITTLGTYAAPTASKIRFKETQLAGVYELHLAQALLGTANISCYVDLKIYGAANLAPRLIRLWLTAIDLQDGVRSGQTALPNAAAEAVGGLFTRGSGAGQINQDANGRIDTRTFWAATGVLTAAAFATDAFTGVKFAADAIAKIADGVWDEPKTGHNISDSMGELFQPIGSGTATAPNGPPITQVTLASASHAVKDAILWFVSATAGAGQMRQIVSVAGANVTFAALTTDLTGTIKYIVLPAPPGETAASIALAVWLLSRASANAVGSFGELMDFKLSDLSTLTPAQVKTQADLALSEVSVTPTHMAKVAALPIASAGTLGGVPTVDANNRVVGMPASGLVASQTEVLAIQNNTRVVRSVPVSIERPDSGTVSYRIELLLYDAAGNMEAPDSAPTIELVNQSGTDRSSRLDSATMALVETGRYRVIYTSSVGDAMEQLKWTFSVIEGGFTRKYGNDSQITDNTAVDFTSLDRADLQLILGRMVGTIAAGTHYPSSGDSFARLGAPTGASHAVDRQAVKADTAAIKVSTDNLPPDPADASVLAAAMGTINTDLSAIYNLLNTEIGEILAKLGDPETGLTYSDLMKLLAAVILGERSGHVPGVNGTILFKNAKIVGGAMVGTKNRITAVYDGQGNVTAITVDLTPEV